MNTPPNTPIAQNIEKRYTLKELMELAQIAKMTIYRHIQQGKLSQPEKWGRSSRWKESEVRKWLDSFSEGLSKSPKHNTKTN